MSLDIACPQARPAAFHYRQNICLYGIPLFMKENISAEHRTLGFLLRYPYDVLSRRVYGSLEALGFPDIRPAHSPVFRHISPSGSRVSDLAERAQMTKQSMAYLVGTLVASGYLVEMPDPNDGRAKLIFLTERGEEVSQSLIMLSREVEQDFATLIGSKRMMALRNLLTELVDALNEE